ncbi:MAG: 5'/3'-nucleotidase SurE [Treponema sp.]|nr:5'/3'-nucleotidase SurE [Treponema sp.]
MKILLTNDDGFDADGLQVLARRLRAEHEVWIVAPVSNRSGVSCSFSINCEHLLQERGGHAYALDASPADCVYSALRGGYLPSLPDIVLSGINHGGNIGTDVVYSGTCGAARQAAFSGIPAAALSVERPSGCSRPFCAADFEPLADFAAKNILQLKELCGAPDAESGRCSRFVNVNAPVTASYRGVRFASLAKRIYHGDRVNIVRKNDENVYSTCIGGNSASAFGGEGCDAFLVSDGYVAVSVLYTEPSADVSFCGKDTGAFVL